MAAISYWNSLPTRPHRYLNLAETLDKHCENDPEKEAFIFYDETMRRSSVTFREAYEQSLSLAAGLLKTYPKIRPGIRVCIYTESKWEYLLSVLAAFRLGVVATLANLEVHHGESLKKLLDNTQCLGIIADYSRLEKESLFESLTERKGWIFTVSDGKGNQTLPKKTLCLSDLLYIGYNSEDTRTRILTQQKEISPDSGALIIFSSGSTGDPKAILRSHFHSLNDLEPCFLETGLTNHDKHIYDSHLSHGIGIVSGIMIPIIFGASTVSVSNKLASSNTAHQSYLSLIEKEKCTSIFLFGFAMFDLVQGSRYKNLNLSSLRKVMTGGQVLSEESTARLAARFRNMQLSHLYTSIECVVAINATGRNILWMKIIGNIEVKIINSNGHVVAMNTPGEICVRSGTMTSGYIIEGEIHTGRDDEGWFHTKDNGKMNESGELFIIGRMSDFIIRGPVNVPILPLEEILDGHSKVKKSAIVPVPDSRLGYDLCACVIPTEPSLSETQVLDWCASNFGNDANGINLRPKLCLLLEDFPLTSNGKISRPKLKELVMKLSE